MDESQENSNKSSLLVRPMFSMGSDVLSPPCLATLSPLPPPPAILENYSLMGLTKLDRVHKEVSTAIERYHERTSSMR